MAVRPQPPDDGRVRTVFLGSGTFAVPALRALAANPLVNLVAVVSAPPRKVGRKQAWTPTPVDAAARGLGLQPVLTPSRLRHPDAIATILALRPELAVLADYGQIVPPPLLDLPHGALNLHPSALPRFRGASPVPAAILAGDRETAVTLMRMDAGLDTGPVVAQAPVPLTGTERAPALEARLADLGAALLERSLPGWLDGSQAATPQPDEGVVLTRPLRREDGRLDATRPAVELERAVRAYDPWPGTFLELEGERLVVDTAHVAPSQPGDRPGDIVREGRLPALATTDGRLVLEEVTPAGRRRMTGDAWLRGRRADG
jgi:methionyl-tRNA formyltransferase